MKNSNGKSSDGFSGFKGGRIVVGLLCLCIIGGLMIYSFYNALDQNSSKTQTEFDEGDISQPSDVSASSNIPVTDSADSGGASNISAAHEDDGNSEKNLSVMPAEGNIIRDYSGDGLAYSETLNQYLSHKAVDIGAPVGTAVVAVESGTVLSVEDDDRYGLTVTLSHGGGLETSYANLSEASVAEGDVVNKGDRIGSVGDESLFEAADDPHLHFAVHKNGEAADPHKLWNW